MIPLREVFGEKMPLAAYGSYNAYHRARGSAVVAWQAAEGGGVARSWLGGWLGGSLPDGRARCRLAWTLARWLTRPVAWLGAACAVVRACQHSIFQLEACQLFFFIVIKMVSRPLYTFHLQRTTDTTTRIGRCDRMGGSRMARWDGRCEGQIWTKPWMSLEDEGAVDWDARSRKQRTVLTV